MMEQRTRHTIMSGEVVDFAESFTEEPGILGPRHEPRGPYHVSASRDAVIVHSADLKGPNQVSLLIDALTAARTKAIELRRNAPYGGGNFGNRGN